MLERGFDVEVVPGTVVGALLSLVGRASERYLSRQPHIIHLLFNLRRSRGSVTESVHAIRGMHSHRYSKAIQKWRGKPRHFDDHQSASPGTGESDSSRQARAINRPDWRLSRQALLWLRLHMVRYDKPLPVYFLVDISRDVVELGSAAVFHFLGAGFLTHLIRHVTIRVNVLV